MLDTEPKKREFPTYTALDRVVLVWGVPLIPLVILAFFTTFIVFGAQALLGIKGTLIGFVAFPVFLFLRQLCESDDQAIGILWLEIKYLAKRGIAYKLFNNTLTFFNTRFSDDAKYIESFIKDEQFRNR